MRNSPLGGATGVRVPAVRSLRVRRLGVLGLLCVVLVLGSSAVGRASPVGGEAVPSVAGDASCPGASSPSTFTGQLSVEGGPLNASAASDVSLTYAYFEEVTVRYSPNGTLLSMNCTEESATTTTDPEGGFSFSIVLPAESCEPVMPEGVACTTYSGPYGPVRVVPVSAAPSGYLLSASQNQSVFDLTWVAELAWLSLSPAAATVALSAGAPGTFVATPETANGTESPLAPSFHWTVEGAGWAFVAPPTAGTATVEGAPGASEGNLSVEASAAEGSLVLATPFLSVQLEAVSTSVVNGSVNRTVVDAGGSVSVTVVATGAANYSYSAVVVPGIGHASLGVPCSTSGATPSTVSVRCAESVTYPAVGTGFLTVNVSNGYSSVTWSSPELSVDPAPALTVEPSSLTGYAGTPLAVTLGVVDGSGSPPYAAACFDPGSGLTLCSDSPGPSWTFEPTFALPGNYSATAWVVDSTGMNRSTSVAVRILGPLELGTLLLGSPNVSAGTPVTLSSSVLGGDLPASLWWNASDLVAPLRTQAVDADGPVSVAFVPPSVGTVRVTLTLIDSLGTAAETSATIPVTVGPATSIELARAPPGTPTVVGAPVPVAWQALDAIGEPVPSFAMGAILSVETASGAPALCWVNGSAVGPLSAFPEGTFAVPQDAWVSGRLNLTITPTVAGELTIRLTGPELPGAPLLLSLAASPDLDRLRLFDPTVVLGGERTNRTYWTVSDRFGNPVPGSYIVVQYLSAGSSTDQLVPVERTADGKTGVWVNYSIPAPGDEVRVLDLEGDVLLGPLSLGGAAVPSTDLPTLVLVLVASSFGAVAALGSRRWRRQESSPPPPDEETEARRLAEGRGAVLEIVRARGTATFASVEAAWDPGPPPPDLGDWVASLAADGTLLVRTRPDGTAEFSVAPEGPSELRVTVDEGALERAVARREAVFREEGEGPL